MRGMGRERVALLSIILLGCWLLGDIDAKNVEALGRPYRSLKSPPLVGWDNPNINPCADSWQKLAGRNQLAGNSCNRWKEDRGTSPRATRIELSGLDSSPRQQNQTEPPADAPSDGDEGRSPAHPPGRQDGGKSEPPAKAPMTSSPASSPSPPAAHSEPSPSPVQAPGIHSRPPFHSPDADPVAPTTELVPTPAPVPQMGPAPVPSSRAPMQSEVEPDSSPAPAPDGEPLIETEAGSDESREVSVFWAPVRVAGVIMASILGVIALILIFMFFFNWKHVEEHRPEKDRSAEPSWLELGSLHQRQPSYW